MQDNALPVFFFFVKPKNADSAQTMAHITSALSVLYVLDLVFGINPVKTAASGFLPINLGATDAAAPATA